MLVNNILAHKSIRIKIVFNNFFAAKCSTKNHFGSPSVCMSVSFIFFDIYSKNLQATHTSKFVIICNIFLRMPL